MKTLHLVFLMLLLTASFTYAKESYEKVNDGTFKISETKVVEQVVDIDDIKRTMAVKQHQRQSKIEDIATLDGEIDVLAKQISEAKKIGVE